MVILSRHVVCFASFASLFATRLTICDPQIVLVGDAGVGKSYVDRIFIS